jgi:hypothetical protein
MPALDPGDPPMNALTIHNPWATWIVDGRKGVENRGFPTKVRGRIVIHAGARSGAARWAVDRAPDGGPIPAEDAMTYGAILGVVDIVDCVRFADLAPAQRTPWHAGPWCWLLANPLRFARPIPMRGQQGFYPIPAGLVLEHIREAEAARRFGVPGVGTPGGAA